MREPRSHDAGAWVCAPGPPPRTFPTLVLTQREISCILGQVYKYSPRCRVADTATHPLPSRESGRTKRDVGPTLGPVEAEALASVFGAMADPTRLRIVSALVDGEVSVGEIASRLGLQISTVSHQLRLLRGLRRVKGRRAGRHVYYSLDDEHVARIYQYALEHLGHV